MKRMVSLINQNRQKAFLGYGEESGHERKYFV